MSKEIPLSRMSLSLEKLHPPPLSNELPPHINTTSLIYCGTFIFQYARECRSSTRAGRSSKLQSEFLLIAFVLGINIPHPGIEIRMEVLNSEYYFMNYIFILSRSLFKAVSFNLLRILFIFIMVIMCCEVTFFNVPVMKINS